MLAIGCGVLAVDDLCGRTDRPARLDVIAGLTIPLARMIAQRPAEIGQRHAVGHWEADLLIFRRAHGQANVTSLVERKSRLTRLVPNDNRRSRQVIGAIGEALGSLPPMARQSITFDRGSEFLGYDELTRSHGIVAYFCDPHSPWQKGSIENANGRLRRFLPGELDLSSLTPAHLHQIERQMNDTPRKCLGFRTPHEAFTAAVGWQIAVPPDCRTSTGTRPFRANQPDPSSSTGC